MAAVMLFLRQTTGKTERYTHFCMPLKPVFTRDCGDGVHFMDEPTSGLDPYERIKFRNIISAYAKDRLVLLSTHIVSDVEHIATQIMMMEYGDVNNIHTGEEYIQMMRGRVWLAEMPAEQLVDYQNQAVISNVRAKDGRMEVRIISDTQPAPDAVQAVPTLEDAYLYLFNYLPGKAGR